MTKIFYDTEFLENGISIKLLSIGMVKEDGETYYAIVNDLDLMERAWTHSWLRKNVMQHLPLYVDYDGDLVWDRDCVDYKYVKPRHEIAEDIKYFINGTTNPELWAYYGAYDHVALCQLYGTMVSLPMGIPMFTHELMQEIEKDTGFVPVEQSEGLHNALEDAEWNKETYQRLQVRRTALKAANPTRTRVW
jgi:hypothetical protein